MEKKKCSRCGKTKRKWLDFGKSSRFGVQPYCKECVRKRNREVLNDPVRYKKLKESVSRSLRKLRLEVIQNYGGCCSCCGEIRWEFLTLDHVNNDGAQERRSMRSKNNRSVYRKAKKMGYPECYRCLCYNCNCAIGHLGYCPHQKEKKVKEDI